MKRNLCILLMIVCFLCSIDNLNVSAASKVPKAKIEYAKSRSPEKLVVKVKSIKNCSYEIKIAANAKMTKNKKVYRTKSSKIILPTKKGKKYYLKVRAYKKSGSKRKYGSWSKTKSIKARKTALTESEMYGPKIKKIQKAFKEEWRGDKYYDNGLYGLNIMNGNYEEIDKALYKETADNLEYYYLPDSNKTNGYRSLAIIGGKNSAFPGAIYELLFVNKWMEAESYAWAQDSFLCYYGGTGNKHSLAFVEHAVYGPKSEWYDSIVYNEYTKVDNTLFALRTLNISKINSNKYEVASYDKGSKTSYSINAADFRNQFLSRIDTYKSIEKSSLSSWK